MTIVAGEQQTMNFYMNHGADWIEPIARGLYGEIAMIDEQHVSHYESLLDPLDSWLRMWVFHEYNEAYLYSPRCHRRPIGASRRCGSYTSTWRSDNGTKPVVFCVAS